MRNYGPLSHGNLIDGNFGTFTWESWDKMPFRCGTPMVSLVSPGLPVACPSFKSVQTMH
jgi:hypothetical protein